jgi:sirohydrochlorin cobaltochelatase
MFFRMNRTLIPVLLLSLLLVLPTRAFAAADSILLVVFGSSEPSARAVYAEVQKQIEAAHPGLPVSTAWTSAHLRGTVKKESSDAPEAVLESMKAKGLKDIAVLPLLVIPGVEYNEIVAAMQAFSAAPGAPKTSLAQPLLTLPEDMEAVAAAVRDGLAASRTRGEAIVLVGHGTHHPAVVAYPAMQYFCTAADARMYIGTIEGRPTRDEALAVLKKDKIAAACLVPLLAIAGDHAKNDIGGDEPDSWKNVFTAAGIKTRVQSAGLAQNPKVLAVWLAHLDAALAELN